MRRINIILDELGMLQNRKAREKGNFYDYLSRKGYEYNDENAIHAPTDLAVQEGYAVKCDIKPWTEWRQCFLFWKLGIPNNCVVGSEWNPNNCVCHMFSSKAKFNQYIGEIHNHRDFFKVVSNHVAYIIDSYSKPNGMGNEIALQNGYCRINTGKNDWTEEGVIRLVEKFSRETNNVTV